MQGFRAASIGASWPGNEYARKGRPGSSATISQGGLLGAAAPGAKSLTSTLLMCLGRKLFPTVTSRRHIIAGIHQNDSERRVVVLNAIGRFSQRH
jgi:hypothetical protein